MSRDLDARARQAAANLKAGIAAAALASAPPGKTTRRRVISAVLRPAWIVALLLLGSAVAAAMVVDSVPASTTVPPATTTTILTASTAAPAAVIEPSPPTVVPVVPVVPVAPTTTAARDTEPPLLEITSPEDGAEFAKKTITFAGVTEPGARVVAGKYEAEVEPSGEWHIVLVLGEGKTVARFIARDAAGNESEASVTVYYVTPTTTPTEPTTTTTVKELAEFSANSTFGSCSETPPYDVYYGTGEPGSLVQITSEYGSGSLEVGENGEWEKKVFFETAAPGKTFVVLVSDEFGRKASFEFVYNP